MPQPAEELYTSDWFRKARWYVKRRMGPQYQWYILSAKYYLLEPDRTVEPYNETLNRMPKRDRLRWGACVLCQLLTIAKAGDTVVLLAGTRYRDPLEPALRAHGCVIETPMVGLRIGEQKAWLTHRIDGLEYGL